MIFIFSMIDFCHYLLHYAMPDDADMIFSSPWCHEHAVLDIGFHSIKLLSRSILQMRSVPISLRRHHISTSHLYFTVGLLTWSWRFWCRCHASQGHRDSISLDETFRLFDDFSFQLIYVNTAALTNNSILQWSLYGIQLPGNFDD